MALSFGPGFGYAEITPVAGCAICRAGNPSLPEPEAYGTRIFAAGEHSLVVKEDNTLWVRGRNDYGQLGDGGNTLRLEWVHVADDVKAVSASLFHTLILKTDNSLWGCGKNDQGELGDGTATNRNRFIKIADHVKSMSGGSSYTLVLKTDNTLWGCGNNTYGQLGNGSTTRQNFLVRITNNVKSISTAGEHTLVVKTIIHYGVAGETISGNWVMA